MPMQPVAQLAVTLHALLQLLQRRATGVRFGTLLLHVLHLGQNLAALLLEDAATPAAGTDQLFLRNGDAFAQFGERFLLEFELGVIGHRQRLALLIQPIAATSDDLQRTLGMAAIG
jgi:hypothetical protein